ncbi:MAG: NTP transferase domain-containing protein [Gemmatimonadota bacterium]|nr:NTP transferase domain-containing protein [Gemmatimonadota bacterium]
MNRPAITLLAAGLSSRYGGAKTLQPVGPDGESLLDYAVHDAIEAGFGTVVPVVRRTGEAAVCSRLRARFGPDLPVRCVRQELWPLPGGHRAPSERVKPWGTGHAVLRVEEAVDGPFAVANADDFYGRSSFGKVAGFLEGRTGEPEFCVVGYRAAATLSSHGGVSRALCEVDGDGRLLDLEELDGVERGEDGTLTGRTGDGRTRDVPLDALVSMNLWGFTPAIFPLLRERFGAFLAAHGEDPGREFALSRAIGDIIRTGEASVTVLPSEEPWFGLTFAADRERVERRIAALVEAGALPPSLRRAMPHPGDDEACG